MLSSLLPEWQLQFAQTLMLRSSQRFCALWWRQEETEQLIVWFSMIQSLHVGLCANRSRLSMAENRLNMRGKRLSK